MEKITRELIRDIYPLNTLSDGAFNKLLPHMNIRWYSMGRSLFSVADMPDDYMYVLEGSVWMADEDELEMTSVSYERGSVSMPLPPVFPSIHSARAITDAKLLLVDRKKLREILTDDKPENAQIREESSGWKDQDPDWKRAFLKAPGFQRIAAHDLQKFLSCLEPVFVKAGQAVIEQGQPADHFYVVAEGQCEVLRSFSKKVDPVRVAVYGPGATLGEDALISNRPRNATVRMLTDGRVMRIDGDDFRFFLKRALARPVGYPEAQQMVARGSRWLDVRMPDEARDGHTFQNSLKIPHPIVRGRLFTADPTLSYVVVCAAGHDAPVIAFTLCKHGFDAYYLKHGATAIPKEGSAEEFHVII